MKLEQCEAGHYYDSDQYTGCPFCGDAQLKNNQTERGNDNKSIGILQRTRERIHTLPADKRCVIAFFAGAVLFMIFYAALKGLDRIPRLYLDLTTHNLFAIYPVLLCFITCLLDEDLIPTIAACIGASVVLAVPFCRDGYVSNAVLIAPIFTFHGICSYFGRKTGWKAAILRSLSLFPTFAFTIGVFAIDFWEGERLIDILFRVLLFIISIICYYLIGRKNAWTTKDMIRAFVIIIPTAFILLIPSMFLYLIFYPNLSQ